MEQWELEARQELQDLLAMYYKYGDSAKLEAQAALFEPDGVVELYGRATLEGRAGIVKGYSGLTEGHTAQPGVTYIRHFSSNYTIEFQSRDEASGDGYWCVVNNHGLHSWGRCRDRYRRGADGRWYFAHRLVRGDTPAAPLAS